jgi:AcrR family transcriptional regulator
VADETRGSSGRPAKRGKGPKQRSAGGDKPGLRFTAGDGPRLRAERSDGVENRQRILAAATVAVAREGLKVPLASVASAAGVGIGTLYRHFPNREALLAGLVAQSLRLVVDAIRTAAREADTAIEAVRGYFTRMIERRDQLILPLRGGPVVAGPEAIELREQVRQELEEILRRGVEDGTIREGMTSFDLILMATMVAQPLPLIADWDRVARRTAEVYLAGLSPQDGRHLTDDGLL